MPVVFYQLYKSIPRQEKKQIYIIDCLTPYITGSKKQSEERAAIFAVRVHVIVSNLY
jgi:hypothetical protein